MAASQGSRAVVAFSAVLAGVAVVVSVAIIGSSVAGVDRAREADRAMSAPTPGTTASAGEAGSWSGADGDVIHLHDLDTSRPIMVTTSSSHGVYITAAAAGAGAVDMPDNRKPYSIHDDPAYVIPTAPDMDLTLESIQPWHVQIAQPELREMDGATSGTRTETLIYRGDATSMRMVSRSRYDTWVDITGVTGREQTTVAPGRVERTIAWADTPLAVIVVQGLSDSAWTLTPQEPTP